MSFHMNVESRALNLFLHQKVEGTEKRIWMAFNFTTQFVNSWEESLLYGGTVCSGSVNLGIQNKPENISALIRQTVEKMNLPCPIARICLYNEADYRGGKKDRLPEKEFYSIHEFLKNQPPKIHLQPEVFLYPSST